MPRWENCIFHRADEAEAFVKAYFCGKSVAYIAGGGFDPRAPAFCKLLSSAKPKLVNAHLLRERRPQDIKSLLADAEANIKIIASCVTSVHSYDVNIFAQDNAVVGGFELLRHFQQVDLSKYDDIVVDVSAVSKGQSFTLVRFLLLKYPQKNIHVFLFSSTGTDRRIREVANEKVLPIKGYEAGYTLDENASTAKLWLPQLIDDQHDILSRIFAAVNPHDVCPIIPFPSRDPRLGDSLISEYRVEIEDQWQLRSDDILYSAENNPLDLYQSLLRLDKARKLVFGENGSVMILSPLGSKATAVGAMMAAIERNFPVVYCESYGYDVDTGVIGNPSISDLIHIWLSGDAYHAETAVSENA